MIKEITAQELDTESFIRTQIIEIRRIVGNGQAINALSGGVDSSTVTLLGHRALGERLKTVIIENGLMRAGEVEQVVSFFQKRGIRVEVIDAKAEFYAALKGITDPEAKREAITQTFYREEASQKVWQKTKKWLTFLSDLSTRQVDRCCLKT